MAQPSGRPRATGSGRLNSHPNKIIRPIQQVRYARLCPFCAGRRGARSASYGPLRFRASAHNVEQVDRSAGDTRRHYEPGMAGYDNLFDSASVAQRTG
jgi:hypothetical protein